MAQTNLRASLQQAEPVCGRILVVDDDPGLLRLLSIRLRAEGYDVEAVETAAEALATLPQFRPDLVVTDLRMENMDGIGLLKEVQRQRPGLCVLLLTAHGTIPDAVEATQTGAFGFLTKPVDKQQLLDHVERAMRVSGLPLGEDEWSSGLITRSPVMEECLQQAGRVADMGTRVLITGEQGTGKELLARAIHRASSRRGQPFVAVNCGSMTEGLLELELFGRDGGARSGAHGGTLFLNEIGDLPRRQQGALLSMLRGEWVRPVGGSEAIPFDTRVISATHQDLAELVLAGNLREDFFYQLNVVNIQLPPLRERREDVPLLVENFLAQIATEAGQERRVYAPEAVEFLVAHEWPGNVRQLYNVVRRNAALSVTQVISAEQARRALGVQAASSLPSFSEARDEFTRNYLSQLLQITGGNVSHAARLAKRNRTDFYKLLGRHQLIPDRFKQAR